MRRDDNGEYIKTRGAKMKFKQYTDILEFEADTLDDLLFNKYQNNKILRIITVLKQQPFNEQIRLAVVIQNSKNVLIGVQTLPHQMLFYFCKDTYNEDALKFYIDKIIELKWDLDKILGQEQTAGHFARFYAQKTGKQIKNDSNLIVYRLDKLCNDKMPAGEFRQFTLDDINIIPYWRAAFFVECGLEPHGQSIEYQFQRTPSVPMLYLWEMDGRVVSMANLTQISHDSAGLQGVYTPPHLRGKGYAFGLVWNLCNRYKDKYKDIMLYADKDYVQSNRLYKRIGFKPLFTNSQYTFE